MFFSLEAAYLRLQAADLQLESGVFKIGSSRFVACKQRIYSLEIDVFEIVSSGF